MIKIDHTAVWVADLEGMREFYEKYFGARAGDRYHNPKKEFYSYFLSFGGGVRLEIMQRSDINEPSNTSALGWAHLAFSVGSKVGVDELTQRLEKDGYEVEGQPRTTGDGYYESVVLDPEGNQIEITE